VWKCTNIPLVRKDPLAHEHFIYTPPFRVFWYKKKANKQTYIDMCHNILIEEMNLLIRETWRKNATTAFLNVYRTDRVNHHHLFFAFCLTLYRWPYLQKNIGSVLILRVLFRNGYGESADDLRISDKKKKKHYYKCALFCRITLSAIAQASFRKRQWQDSG